MPENNSSGFASGSWGSPSSFHRNSLSRAGNSTSLLTAAFSLTDPPAPSEHVLSSSSRSSLVWERSPRLVPVGSFQSLRNRSPRLVGMPGSKRSSFFMSPKMEKTERKWDIVFQLNHHIEDHITLQLPPEPSKFTDDFTEWVHFDPRLFGLERQALYDDWYRKGGGRTGKSLSRSWSDREALRTNLTRELKLKVARLWAAGGKFFPFTKSENVQWRQRRKDRGILSGFGVVPSTTGGGGGGTSPNEVVGFASEEEHRASSGRTAHGKEEDIEAATSDNTTTTEAQVPTWSGKKKRWDHRSGEADFRRAIVAPCVTVERYLSSATMDEWTDTSSSGGLSSYDTYARALRLFNADPTQRVLRLPLGLERGLRRRLHEAAEVLGIRTMSFGDGNKRFLVAVKRDVVVFRD